MCVVGGREGGRVSGGQDLIGGFDGVVHDAADAFLGELGEVGSRVVFTLQVLAPVGLCVRKGEGGREGGCVSEKRAGKRVLLNHEVRK